MSGERERLPNRRCRRVAVHEAAHAVAAIVLGQPFEFVEIAERTLDDGRECRGRVHYADLNPIYPAVELAMGYLAGPIAEARCSHQSLCGILLGGGSDDYFHTKEALEDSRHSYDDAETWTRQLVTKNWGAIVAVANDLIGRGRLEYAEVARLSAALGVNDGGRLRMIVGRSS
jgi:hypothetical protein